MTKFTLLNEKFKLAIVGKIPSGILPPELPEFSMFSSVINDAIIISLVAFAVSVSVSDLYARKHNYKINANKELFALGMANLVGSFFRCFTSCGALARTVVVDSSGGKSQLVTVIASTVLLSVMLWFSMVLEYLPKVFFFSIWLKFILILINI